MNIRFASLLFLLPAVVWAQDKDTTTLPFSIAASKKLPEEELANKKEGSFVTGVPELSVDPVNGFGYGVEGSWILNGKKSNPFFDYTPYLTKLDVVLFNTARNQREIAFKLDKPYLLKSKWRLRMELAYEINPNLLYFGINSKSLATLNNLSVNDGIPNPPYTGKNYEGYDKSLTGIYSGFNQYTKEEFIFNASGEYSFLDCKMRILAGVEAAFLNIIPNNNNARLNRDAATNTIIGTGKSFVTFIQTGLVYDTRDLEPDPNKGIFAELTNEFSSRTIGSDYNMDKLFLHIKGFQRIIPAKNGKIILAWRFGIGYTFGNAPFFEYQDEWSSEGSIEGLGGTNTLRGYKQSRFLDRGVYFGNLELRTRFAQTKILKQHLAFSVVPFADAGSVMKNLQTFLNIKSIRYNEGIGLRIAWNMTTILRFDYAISKEDKQFFFTFEQAF